MQGQKKNPGGNSLVGKPMQMACKTDSKSLIDDRLSRVLKKTLCLLRWEIHCGWSQSLKKEVTVKEKQNLNKLSVSETYRVRLAILKKKTTSENLPSFLS